MLFLPSKNRKARAIGNLVESLPSWPGACDANVFS